MQKYRFISWYTFQVNHVVPSVKCKKTKNRKQKRILLRLDSFQVFTNHLFDNVNSDNFMDFPLNFNQLLMCACTAIWRKIILKLAQLEFYLNSNLKRLALCDSYSNLFTTDLEWFIPEFTWIIFNWEINVVENDSIQSADSVVCTIYKNRQKMPLSVSVV